MTTFVTSDTHFHHTRIVEAKDNNLKLRPFDSVEEMNEFIVEQWNSVVSPRDRVYHLGDVSFSRKGLDILSRLNGRKVLARGNHDIYDLKEYCEYFEDVRGCFYRDGLVFSHFPVHPDCLARPSYQANVHGHLHRGQVLTDGVPDGRYFNACVENHGFTPVSLDFIKQRLAHTLPG